MVLLESMSEREFQKFFSASSRVYARANVESGRWVKEGAEQRAIHQLKDLLPDGINTPDRWVFNITVQASRETAGYLFFAAVEQGGLRSGYIYDFEILPAFRRRGFAQAALCELERFANSLDLPFIDLHVFGSNAGAQALYDRQGYFVEGVQMRKMVSETPPGE